MDNERIPVPKEDFILVVLEVLEKFGILSAREIHEKLQDKNVLKKLGILDRTKTKMPSYPTICRILHFLDKERSFIKWVQEPTKEMRYQIKSKGKMYLAGLKCEGRDYVEMLLNPANCGECSKDQIEKCWDDELENLQELISKRHFGDSLNLKDSQKTEIKKIFEKPSEIAQICSYYELCAEINPFFNKHLRHFANKIKILCKK